MGKEDDIRNTKLETVQMTAAKIHNNAQVLRVIEYTEQNYSNVLIKEI